MAVRPLLGVGASLTLFLAAAPRCLADDAPRLILVDAVVLDRGGRTVPDLAKDDFQVSFDGKTVPVETFEVNCPIGAVDDPVRLRGKQRPTKDARPRESAARLVFAVDYYHLDSMADRRAALEYIRRSVSTRLDGTEELMLVAIGEGAHITQPFTRDHAGFLTALPRMSRDKELWEETLEHPSEHPLFASLEELMEDLAEIAGPKALVLFTDGAWRLESTFPRLVAAAGQARVAVYPVLASGLTDGSGPYPGVCPTRPSGDPTGMQSLASATGGRATHVTNDLTLAAARAGRDLGCRYTLGVYDLEPKDDAVHEIGLVVRPAGLQVLHTGAYRFASWPK